jgi:hypothetical protein
MFGMAKPAWLDEARDFGKRAGIEITGWGPDLLTVGSEVDGTGERNRSSIGQLGFKIIENEDDE